MIISDSISDPSDIWLDGNEREIVSALAEAYIDRFGQATESSPQEVASDYRERFDLLSVLGE